MQSQNGTEYAQNYDVIVKWLADVLRGETLETLGIQSGRIATTLILSNKLIDKEVLLQIWEEVKMLDILEIAREKGIEEGLQKGKTLGLQEGKALGLQEGKTLGLQEVVIDTLSERFGIVPARLSEQIRGIHNQDTLKSLFHQSLKCPSLQDFENSLQQVL